jgi:hypothetical protein
MALIGALLVYWWAFPPNQPPIGTANGVYANACCGLVKLHDGLMTFNNNQFVSYIVERDKVGRYVLPQSYVGASDSALIVRRGDTPLKLYLSDELHPHHLYPMSDGAVFSFARITGSK